MSGLCSRHGPDEHDPECSACAALGSPASACSALVTDPQRENEQMHGLTGIFVRAKGKDGRLGAYDIAELDSQSLTAWLKRDGGDNLLAENCIRVMLGHDQIPPND